MQTLPTLQPLTGAFAYNGTKNVIPNNPTGSHLASLAEGFPPITMLPLQLGGVPPEGADFNGILNLTTQFYFAYQNGLQPTFSQAVSDAIGGYPKGAVLWNTTGTAGQLVPIVSLVGDNTYNFVTNPEYIDGVHWAIAWSTNYLGVETLPAATSFTTVSFAGPGPAIKKLTIPAELLNLTITIAVPTDTAAGNSWTYELHVTAGTTVPFITWETSGTDAIHWLTDSPQQIQEADATGIFVFRWQDGILIGNYGGAY